MHAQTMTWHNMTEGHTQTQNRENWCEQLTEWAAPDARVTMIPEGTEEMTSWKREEKPTGTLMLPERRRSILSTRGAGGTCDEVPTDDDKMTGESGFALFDKSSEVWFSWRDALWSEAPSVMLPEVMERGTVDAALPKNMTRTAQTYFAEWHYYLFMIWFHSIRIMIIIVVISKNIRKIKKK